MSTEELASRSGSGSTSARPASLTTLSPELLSPFFHEFRTSLTMIKTCIALLTNPNISYDPTELREFMDIVRRGGDRVDRLVRDFLAILKLESGMAEREAREAEPTRDVVGPIQAVVRSLQPDIVERNLTVQVDVEENLPPLPIFDEHFQIIVEKLLHNAVKFSKPEGGQVTIRVRRADGKVRFQVIDQGIGIPREEQERIFDRFYQLTRAGLERQGAGLGLAVARGLAELYGGTIEVQSQVDVGSTFTVTLPLRPLPEPVEETPPPAKEGAILTAEEAFRRLGITFEEQPQPEEEKKGRRGLFGFRKK